MIEKGLRLRAERWWFTQHYGFGLWNQIRKGWVDFYLKIFLSLQIIGKGFLFFFVGMMFVPGRKLWTQDPKLFVFQEIKMHVDHLGGILNLIFARELLNWEVEFHDAFFRPLLEDGYLGFEDNIRCLAPRRGVSDFVFVLFCFLVHGIKPETSLVPTWVRSVG